MQRKNTMKINSLEQIMFLERFLHVTYPFKDIHDISAVNP